jgi:STE24 endopeptidase
VNENKATRYHRVKRRLRLASGIGGAVLLAAFQASGWSHGLRDAVAALTAPAVTTPLTGALLVAAAYVTVLVCAAELVALPLACAGFLVDRRFGLVSESQGQWLRDQGKGLVVALVLALLASQVAYAGLHWSTTWWWLPTALVFSGLSVGLAFAGPLVLFPLFYHFAPLSRDGLRDRLMALAQRAGTRVLGVYEWKLGEKSRAANAALVGLGRTRRILVSDTMLADYSDDEIEVVLAHELAHHVHGDIRASLAVDVALTVVALLAGHLALTVLASPLGLRGVADIAGLPVLLLGGGAVSLASLPAINALSRMHERRADGFALDTTGNAAAFVSAMKRLAAQNLADEHPSRLVELLFHSHPTIPQRIEAAERWQRTRAAQPLSLEV